MKKKVYLKPYMKTTFFCGVDVLFSSLEDKGSQEDHYVTDPFAPVVDGKDD